MVNDRDDVGKTFPGACSGGQDVVRAASCVANRFFLVFVKTQGASAVISRVILVLPEDPGAGFVEDLGVDEVLDPCSGFKGRIKLDERLGPEDAGIEALIDVPTEILVLDVDESPDVLGVVFDEAVSELENVHRTVLSILFRMARGSTSTSKRFSFSA